jgi:cytochrome P450
MSSSTLQPPQVRDHPPSLPGYPLVGVLPVFRRDPLRLLTNAARQYGDVVHMQFGPTRSYLVNHPDEIQHVLQTNNRNYRREGYGNQVIKLVTGLNLLTSDGDYWLQQRRLMAPAFHRQRITSFGTLMAQAAQGMLSRWDEKQSAGGWVDAHREMMRVTMEIVGRALFSIDLSGEANTLGMAFVEGMDYLNYRLNHVFAWPLFLPTPRNFRLRRALAAIDRIIQEMIEERRQSGEEGEDLLSMLLEARYEDTGLGMTDEQLQNEMGILIGAGHETTANALTWTFYLLSENPEVEEALHRELDQVLQGRAPAVSDLPALPYTRMVIEESMRLYPPAWILTGRETIAEDQIAGYTIPARSTVFISPYVTQRDPRFWPDPERFDPNRFAPEAAAERPRFAYLPFGGGPRKCIGADFAMTESQLILAAVAQRYCLRLKPGWAVEPDPIFTLRIRGGLPMRLEAR